MVRVLTPLQSVAGWSWVQGGGAGSRCFWGNLVLVPLITKHCQVNATSSHNQHRKCKHEDHCDWGETGKVWPLTSLHWVVESDQ